MNIKGWLDALTLAVCSAAPAHGYAIAAELRDAGVGDLADASLYPVLKRLSTDGLLVAEWETTETGPARKVYSMTPDGRAALEAHAAEWKHVRKAMDAVFARGLKKPTRTPSRKSA